MDRVGWGAVVIRFAPQPDRQYATSRRRVMSFFRRGRATFLCFDSVNDRTDCYC